MNERIQQLMNQAMEDSFMDGLGGPRMELNPEKFAELIIQECVQQCEAVAQIAETTNRGEMARKTKSTAQSCGQMIKMRFGFR